jgi:hypothetical protein
MADEGGQPWAGYGLFVVVDAPVLSVNSSNFPARRTKSCEVSRYEPWWCEQTACRCVVVRKPFLRCLGSVSHFPERGCAQSVSRSAFKLLRLVFDTAALPAESGPSRVRNCVTAHPGTAIFQAGIEIVNRQS